MIATCNSNPINNNRLNKLFERLPVQGAEIRASRPLSSASGVGGQSRMCRSRGRPSTRHLPPPALPFGPSAEKPNHINTLYGRFPERHEKARIAQPVWLRLSSKIEND